MEENGLAVGPDRAHCAGREIYGLAPIDIRGEELPEDRGGPVVGGVDGVYEVEGDCGVIGDGEAGEAFGVAELRGCDVLEKLRDRLCAGYIAWLGEELGVGREELPPALGGLVVPGEDFFGGEDGVGHAGS